MMRSRLALTLVAVTWASACGTSSDSVDSSTSTAEASTETVTTEASEEAEVEDDGLARDPRDVAGMALPLIARSQGSRITATRFTIDAPYDQIVRFYREYLPEGTQMQRFERGTRFRLEDGTARAVYIFREDEFEPYSLNYYPGDWRAENSALAAYTGTGAQGANANTNPAPQRSGNQASVNMAEVQRQAESRGGTLPADHPNAGMVQPAPANVSDSSWGRPAPSTREGAAQAANSPQPDATENPYELERHLGREVSTGSIEDAPSSVSFGETSNSRSGSGSSSSSGGTGNGLPGPENLDFVRGVVEHPTNPDALF